MEIKVGEYVRTEFGNIGKFYRPASESSDVYYIYINKDGNKISSRYDSIVKHSNNIIDLIEIGDILRVFDNLSETEEKVNIFDDEMLKAVKKDIKDNNYKILSILTHEQFSSLEYII